MTNVEQKILDILAEKQTYLREKKGINEVYFGTEYAKRICDHNGYTPEQVTTAIKSLRKNGFIMGQTGKEGVYGYMTIQQPKVVEKQTTQQDEVPNDIPAKMADNDIVAKMAHNSTYTYQSGYTQFIITVAA